MNRWMLAASCSLVLAAYGYAEDLVQIGRPAPDVTMTGIDGNEFKLSDITKSGKNVALIFSRAHW